MTSKFFDKQIFRKSGVLFLGVWFLVAGAFPGQAEETRDGEPGKERAIAKFLGKTMKMATRVPFKKFSESDQASQATAPSIRYPGGHYGLAAWLFDPQRKESPIHTAMLFKIPLPTVAEPVPTGWATALSVSDESLSATASR